MVPASDARRGDRADGSTVGHGVLRTTARPPSTKITAVPAVLTRRVAVRVVIAALALAVASAVAYLVDKPGEGEVARSVTVGGRDVSGMDRAELASAVRGVGRTYARSKIRVETKPKAFDVPAESIGLIVDERRTTQAALSTGRGGWWAWLTSFVGEERADVAIEIDPQRLRAEVHERDPGEKAPPVEPSIELDDGRFRAVDGKPGRGIDPADVAKELDEAAPDGVPLEVEVERGPVPPRFSRADAERLAREAEDLAVEPMRVTAGTARAEIPAGTLRTWLGAKAGPDRLELTVDEDKAGTGLPRLLPNAGKAATEAKFSVSGGRVNITGGESGTACCAPEAGSLLARALLERRDEVVTLPLKKVEPKLSAEKARGFGIKELVGTFTTPHKSGEARVKNIHRIADLTRGHIIDPGESFSVNGFVGRRTTARGFVPAPVIEEGHFTEDVGGGISQFATTLFNAAFLAGLDFGEYQSHSIYITRYPYGREATLNYPHPDLVIRNTTPHGVLLWPTYTGSSITVSLYSTKTYEVRQSGQTKEPDGVCTKVRTERTRTPLGGGAPKVDAVHARYRPEEGMNCSGERTAPPTTTTTTTKGTTRPTTTTTKPE